MTRALVPEVPLALPFPTPPGTLRSLPMSFAREVSVHLLQAATFPDTIITRTVAVRGVFEWTSGVLQIVVLVLGIGVLIATIFLILSMRASLKTVEATVDRLVKESAPLLANATGIVTDAREVVAIVRTDVERVTDAVGALSAQLLHAAEVTTRRVDDVNAVLDVLQSELEDTALSAAATMRGVRVGADELSNGLRHPRTQRPVDLMDDDDDS